MTETPSDANAEHRASEQAGVFEIGTMRSVPARDRTDLLSESTLRVIEDSALLGVVGVVEIEPEISDTAATQAAFDLPMSALANCVVVAGKREGTERFAACVVLATTRADVNGVVRRLLDVRKASFLETTRAVALTGMEYGGITPFGLPPDWPILVDRRVVEADVIVVGSGIRRSKILLCGEVLRRVPNVEIVEQLGR
jgi:prolyl-tRNA editing enzyme YbaK/EbsC (Cys-tRNA(Pro) deacylase)